MDKDNFIDQVRVLWEACQDYLKSASRDAIAGVTPSRKERAIAFAVSELEAACYKVGVAARETPPPPSHRANVPEKRE